LRIPLSVSLPRPLIRTEPTHTGVVDVLVRTFGRRSTALLVKTDFSPPTPLIRTTPPNYSLLIEVQRTYTPSAWEDGIIPSYASDTYRTQPPITNRSPTYLQPFCLGRRNLPLLRLRYLPSPSTLGLWTSSSAHPAGEARPC